MNSCEKALIGTKKNCERKKKQNWKRQNKIKRDEGRVSEAPEGGKGAAEKNNPI